MSAISSSSTFAGDGSTPASPRAQSAASCTLDPLTPHINYFHARPRDLRTRWTSTKPIGDSDPRLRGHREEVAE